MFEIGDTVIAVSGPSEIDGVNIEGEVGSVVDSESWAEDCYYVVFGTLTEHPSGVQIGTWFRDFELDHA